jgi:hypothetical protein
MNDSTQLITALQNHNHFVAFEGESINSPSYPNKLLHSP